MPIAKCPDREHQVNELDLADLDAEEVLSADRRVVPAVAYICPHCKKIIGVGLDPRAHDFELTYYPVPFRSSSAHRSSQRLV